MECLGNDEACRTESSVATGDGGGNNAKHCQDTTSDAKPVLTH